MQVASLGDILKIEQGAGTRSAFVVCQEGFQAKVETAAFTRAGFANFHLLHHAEEQPQMSHWIALDGQRLDLTIHRTMLHKLVLDPIYLNRAAYPRELPVG